MVQPLVVDLKKDGMFCTKRGGNEFNIMRTSEGWNVTVTNASTKAWNRGFGKMLDFTSLDEVEAHYKSLKGIKNVVAMNSIPASSLCS